MYVGIATVYSLVACSQAEPSGPDGPFFPTVPRLDAYPSALFSGRLVERAGCLTGAERVLLWPDGYSARIGPDGRTQVIDEDEMVIGIAGEHVMLGGGEVGASFNTQTTQQTPEACVHRYWLVAPS
jgi:hypothetical protein